MKNSLLFILFLVGGYLQAQIVNIPDANFKNGLLNSNWGDIGNGVYENINTNNDDEIQVSEAEAVVRLRAQLSSISSLEGIESFINLEELRCGTNDLTTIDISGLTELRVLSIDLNDLVTIDISNNLLLERFTCSFNLITSLDVGQNTALTYLDCNVNQLSSIDLSTNINLEVLAVPGNVITSIDLSSNQNLIEFNCRDNQISNLDLEQNVLLERLNFSINNVSSIDLSSNLNLISLSCFDNDLTELDISDHPDIFNFRCYDNDLQVLNIRNGNNTSLNYFDATGNPNLDCIQVDDVTYSNSQICDIFQNESWCKDAVASYSDDCQLGIEGLSNDSFILYPNPVRDLVSILSTRTRDLKSIGIYDTHGRLISEEKMTRDQLDVSSLQAGIYFLKIQSGFDFRVLSFLKE